MNREEVRVSRGLRREQGVMRLPEGMVPRKPRCLKLIRARAGLSVSRRLRLDAKP